MLDIAMPDGDGLSVCAELRTLGLATRALMLTMYDDDENVLAALRAGAYGYTLKGAGRTSWSPPFGRWRGERPCSERASRPGCSRCSAARRVSVHSRS